MKLWNPRSWFGSKVRDTHTSLGLTVDPASRSGGLPEAMRHDGSGGGDLASAFYRLAWEGVGRREMASKVGDGLHSSAWLAPALWLARAFPEARLVPAIDANRGRELAWSHPIVRLLERPNDFYAGSVLWFGTVLALVCRGNSYWIKVRNRGGAGDPVNLWFVPPGQMRPRWSADGLTFVDWYEYAPGDGHRYALEPRDVVHLRYGIDPRNPRVGLSPLDGVLSEVFTDDEAARFTSHVLGNLGVVGFIVTPEPSTPQPEPAELRKTKAYVEEMTTGENRGRPLVLGAPTRVTRIDASLQGLDLAAVRNIPEERACAVLGIPAAVAGLGSGLEQTKVGATMREMVRLAWHGGVIPLQRMLAEQLEVQLFGPDFQPARGEYLWWDRSEVDALREDENARNTRTLERLKAGAIQVAEARAEWGMEVGPEHAIYLRPLGAIEVPAGAAPVDGRMLDDPDGDDAPKALEVKRATLGQARFMRRLEWAQPRLAKRLEREVGRALAVFGEELERIAGEVLGKAAHANAKADGPLDPDAVRARLEAEAIANQARIQAFGDILAGVYGRHYLRVFEDTVGALDATLGIALDLPDEVARRVFDTGGRRLGLVDLDGQTRERLFEVIREQRTAGQNPLTMARRIRDLVPAGTWSDTATRARVIARTETLHAQRVSTLEAYRAADSVTAIRVFDNRIGWNDEDCVARNGRVVSFDEAAAMMDEEHPNGTLNFAPVVGDS